MPLPTVQSAVGVPWNPEPLKGRCCANCACHYTARNEENPLESRSFCRRWSSIATPGRIPVPRLDENQKPMIDKRTGEPIMGSREEIVYFYQPTKPDLICFDGYRPLGTLPGESPVERRLRKIPRVELEEFMEDAGESLPTRIVRAILELDDAPKTTGT